MKLIGLDVGTTTICGLLLDAADGRIVSVITEPNRATLPETVPGDSLQDPQVGLKTALGIVNGFLDSHRDIRGIGVAGQMHGILYIDGKGNALSPLYTWQDGRGDRPFRDGTYASWVSQALGRPVSTGMGLVTHFYNQKNDLVPAGASSMCTIMDFVAMKLSGAAAPVMDPTNAASLGGFDPGGMDFLRGQFGGIGIEESLFPAVSANYVPLGDARPGVPVFPALGDNQASFLGSVRDSARTALVSVGTSSQISLRMESWREIPGIDVRPMPFGGCLGVGAGLCGGRALAIVRNFFRSTVRLVTGRDAEIPWDVLNGAGEASDQAAPDGPGSHAHLVVNTRFAGTRVSPEVRGSVTNIGLSNLTPGELVRGVREGIVSELADFYELFSPAERARISALVGSGNAVRLNPALRRSFEARFGMRLNVPRHREETSFGAALVAGIASGVLKDRAAAGALVRYEEPGA
ncbi:MAG TPA: FGGY family carbohydrate kinase [Spirochaetia bacterium]|nr:FGGY family carbohydrate kinase [Spirochaetia bacterium]